MGIRRRAGKDGAPVMADAEGQAAWDDDAAPRPGRRRRLLGAAALGLAALVLLAALVVSRSRPDGNVLALGPASDPSGLPPVDDMGLLTDGGPGGQSQLTPGDSIPSVAAGDDPAAAAAAAAAAGGAPGGGTPGAPGGAGTPAGGGAATGIPNGPGPRDGIPIPTTQPGSSPTTGPGPPPPPPTPRCTIEEPSLTLNPAQKQRGGGSKKLIYPVSVIFRPTNCGGAEFRVQVPTASPRVDTVASPSPTRPGFLEAAIGGEAKYSEGEHTVVILGGVARTTLELIVVELPR